MTRRLLLVHAHPDDEASKGAATAARYADAGAEVVLVTCTGGEAGEVLNPSHPPVAPEEMPSVRRRELDRATKIIGFTRVHQLGYPDSGYHEDPSGIPEGTFARTPVEEPAAALAAILRAERPHVVVTYPEDGGYPHPDHIMVHEVTLRALEVAEGAEGVGEGEGDGGAGGWRVPKVYANTAFPPERVLGIHEALRARDLPSPFEGWLERHAARERHDPPPCTALVRVGDWFDRRDDALRAHATQVDPDGFWFQVPRDLERSIYPFECFTLLRSDVAVDPPEDDLFAGLEDAAAPEAAARSDE